MGEENLQGGPREACRRFDLELSAYLEGEGRPYIRDHARDCAYCAVVLADLEILRAECRSLELAEPSAVLWTNVRAALRAEGVIRPAREPWFRRLSPGHVAGPVGALACLGVLAALLLVPPASIDSSRSAGWLAITDRDRIADQVIRREDAGLAQTVAELQKAFEGRQAHMAPAVKASYRQGLDSLDTSIRECQESIRREPANTLARQYLVAAYTQKVEILNAALEYDAR